MRRREKIFNLFPVFNHLHFLKEVGAYYHKLGGTDQEKIKFLQDRVHEDWETAKIFPVSGFRNDVTVFSLDGMSKGTTMINYSDFAKFSMQKTVELFEIAFKEMMAPINPIIVITPIIDGKPRYDGVINYLEPAH